MGTGTHSAASIAASASSMPALASTATRENMVWIDGGTFVMGSDRHSPEEAPAHEVTVRSFWIDETLVTNAEFSRFVRETGYLTVAERPASASDHPGARAELLVPSSIVFQSARGRAEVEQQFSWWAYVPGASWRHPRGPGSEIDAILDHPVVHVAFEDAIAYASWAGKQLPTEAEWEFAARGGLHDAEYVWGNELRPGGALMANTWQGEFPWQNLVEDGYEWTSPVRAFPPNGYGLYDMAGNVWQWTSDWYIEHAHRQRAPLRQSARGGLREEPYDRCMPNVLIPRKVVKGGSFLCGPDRCQRFRPAARLSQLIDTSICDVGFRCVVRPVAGRLDRASEARSSAPGVSRKSAGSSARAGDG